MSEEQDLQEYVACVKLWQRVLLQMFLDLLITSSKTENVEAKADAHHWFANCPANVRLVCEYAQLDYRKVITAYQKNHQPKAEPAEPLKTFKASYQPSLPLEAPIIAKSKPIRQHVQNMHQLATSYHQLELWG